MSYVDIEQELNDITGNLQQKLKDAGAIDENDDAKNIAKFNQIIDGMIDKCNKILQQLEIERYNPNSNNLVQSRIQWLRTVKGTQTLNWHTGTNSDREEKIVIGSDYGSLREILQDATKRIPKLFGFQRNRAPQKTRHEK